MQPKKMNKSLLIIASLSVLLALGLVIFFWSGAFSTQHIVVQGLKLSSESEILKLAGGVQGQNLLLVDQEALQQRITLHPLVQSVRFQRQLPQTLIIIVTERTPAALVVVPKGVLEVDARGIFIRRLESWPTNDQPVLTGIDLQDTVGPGQDLANPSLTAALSLLAQAPPDLLSQIGELHVDPSQQMTIYLRSGVEVRLGQASDWKAKLDALFQLISTNEYLSFEQGVRYIDFTAAQPVIGR